MSADRMHIKIGTRASLLARTQSEMMAAELRKAGCSVELVTIVTSGDRFLGKLTDIGGKGLFVKEIEEALLAKEIDLAVHSLKDMPALLPAGLCLAATPLAEDPRDALILCQGSSLHDLPDGAVVGTSSLRRQMQLQALRPDLTFVPLRGNVETRIRKLHEGTCDATILAAAGLNRLQKTSHASYYFSIEKMVPAAGQGVLALEAHENNFPLIQLLQKVFHDPATHVRVAYERAFLQACGGDCKTPVAAHAVLHDHELKAYAFLADPTTSYAAKLTASTEASVEAAQQLGTKLAEQLQAQVRSA